MAEFRLDDGGGHQDDRDAHQGAEQAPQQVQQAGDGQRIELPARRSSDGEGPLLDARFGGLGLAAGGVLAALALALSVLSIFGGGDADDGDKGYEHIEDVTPTTTKRPPPGGNMMRDGAGGCPPGQMPDFSKIGSVDPVPCI